MTILDYSPLDYAPLKTREPPTIDLAPRDTRETEGLRDMLAGEKRFVESLADLTPDLPSRVIRKAIDTKLGRSALDDIAELTLTLTYGEMMELAAGIWSAKGEDELTAESLPGVLYRWASK